MTNPLSALTAAKSLTDILDFLPISDPAKVSSTMAILTSYAKHEMPITDARVRLEALIGTSEPLEKISSMMEPAGHFEKGKGLIRKQAFRWTPDDDARLIAAVETYGVDNWPVIAHEIGGGRSRAQCAQRWVRCLDPAISKCTWTVEEEQRLLDLVAAHGTKAWVKIARALGGRSDVQCRFRFFFLSKKAGENGTPLAPISELREKPEGEVPVSGDMK
jgi:hypothetical protein